MSYSQNNEEEIILKYFGDFVGTFCDIGANDGKTFSNTARLAELGWAGVMIEPHPGAYEVCKIRYSDNPQIAVFNCAIGPKTEVINFHLGSDSLLSTAIVEHKKYWPTTEFNEAQVQQYKWRDFRKQLSQKHFNFDFISIDAEGMDWVILQQIDLSQIDMLCVEHGEDLADIQRYCRMYGLKEIHRTPQNSIYAK